MRAPKGLKPKGRRFWKNIMAEWEFTEAQDLELLAMAASCLDRIREAENTLQEDGPYQKRGDVFVAHPANKVLREEKSIFLRVIRELDLNEIEINKPQKPLKKGRGH